MPRAFTCTVQLPSFQAPVTGIAWSPDGGTLALPAQTGILSLWSAAERRMLDEQRISTKALWTAAWCPDGTRLAVAGRDNCAYLYETATGRVGAPLSGHTDDIHGLAFIASGAQLVTGSFDGSLKLWDVRTGELSRSVKAHDARIEHVAFSERHACLLSCSDDATARVWDARSFRELRVFEGHEGFVLAAAVSGVGTTVFTASTDGTVRVWDLSSGAAQAVIEGFTGTPHSLSVSSDSALLAVKDDHSRVRIYRTDTLEIVDSIEEHADHHHWYGGVAFHPTDARLATLGEQDRSIRLWEYPREIAERAEREASARLYASAKVALLGDTGVGKSSLAQALRGEPCTPTTSTHGTKVSLLSRVVAETPSGGVTREVFLWDFAGQPAYRLLQQLDLNDISVALLVFDNRSPEDPLFHIREWETLLRRASGTKPSRQVTRILVAARVDRGGSGIGQTDFDPAGEIQNYGGFLETSVRSELNIDALHDLLLSKVPWDHIPVVASDEQFQRLRVYVAQRSAEDEKLTRRVALYRGFCSYCNRLERPAPDVPSFAVQLGGLESQDLLKQLSSGDLILLDPTVLRSYASMIVIAAMDAPRADGSLDERAILDGEIPLIEDERLERRSDEPEILAAAVAEFMEAGVVVREGPPGARILRFPSAAAGSAPRSLLDVEPSQRMRVTGSLDYTYARIVVSLSSAGIAERTDLFRHLAAFHRPDDTWSAISVAERSPGVLEFESRHSPELSRDSCALVDELLKSLLKKLSVGGSLESVHRVVCPDCGTSVLEEQVRRRLARGFDWLRCSVCETEVDLVPAVTPVPRELARSVTRSEDQARATQQRAARETALDLKVDRGRFDVFISYCSEEREAVLALADRLLGQGIRPWVDVRELQPGRAWMTEIQRQIESIRSAAVVVGPSGIGPWQQEETMMFLEAFVAAAYR